MKKIAILCLCSVFAMGTASSQETDQEPKLKDRFNFSVSLRTSHLWRGLIITDKPVTMVLTSLDLNKSGSITTGFWGGMAFANESDGTHYKEIDYFVQYAHKGFSIGLWDLFNTRGVESPDIWNYDENTTGHILDLRTSYNFGAGFPLRLEADVILWGTADSFTDVDGIHHKYSTYAQASYTVPSATNTTFEGFVGAGLAFNGETHLYGNGENTFDIVNLGLTVTKKIKIIDDIIIPVSATTLWNPSVKYARMQLAVSF